MKINLTITNVSYVGYPFLNIQIVSHSGETNFCFGGGLVGIAGTCFNNTLIKNKDWETKDMRKVGRVIYNYNLIIKKEHKDES